MSALPTAQEALSTALDHLGDMSVEVLTAGTGWEGCETLSCGCAGSPGADWS
jgi:hypothetical protein